MLRVLLIDDNPNDRLLAARELRREFADLHVQEIAKADDLNEAIQRGAFDLAITDYQLRWTDGLTVLRRLKQFYPHRPVIMFTNSGDQEIAVAAMKAGLDDYVIKAPRHYIRLVASARTALKQAEAQQKVAALESRFQTLLNRLNVGVYRLVDADTLLEANAAFFRLMGLEELADVPENQSIAAYFNPEDYARLIEQLTRDGQPIRKHEALLKRADGSTIWVQLSKTFTPLGNKLFVDGFIEDITRQKDTEAALRDSETRLMLALKAGGMGTWDWDLQTDAVAWSEGHFQLLGLVPGSIVPDYHLWINTMHPDDRDRVQQTMQEARQTHAEYRAEYRTVWPDGSVHWTEARGGFLFDPAQISDATQPQRMSGVVIDITERKQVEQEREQLLAQEKAAREEAETANRVKDEFLAVLSHELRSPLNPILGWTKLLRTRKFDEQGMQRALATIERNAELQTQLIEDLLDISRILRGKLALSAYPVKLTTIIEAALETVRLAAEVKQIETDLQLDSSVGSVSGDAGRLQQVIWNLLSNAVKFTPPNGRIQVRLLQVEQSAQIEISDTGQGIHPDFLPHVFDYFRQADSTTTRRFGGLGLGLAIARRLTELHGGTIAADSAGEGQGATFTVKLPLLPQANEPVPHSPVPSAAEYPSPVLQGLQVLIVDDEPDSRELLAEMLSPYGVDLRLAASAAEALSMLDRQKPDVILSDIGMPETDGYMLIQQIRARLDDRGSQIPAIALTAYAGEINQQRALTAGFQQHLSKPVEAQVLVQTIVQLVEAQAAAVKDSV